MYTELLTCVLLKKKKKEVRLGLVVHICSPSTQRHRQKKKMGLSGQ